MTTQSSTTAVSVTGGCGCGGDCGGGCGGGCSGGCGGGCSCGGTCASGMTGGTAFVRPRFFGGMLLTEDDLQAIDDYTVAKRRLTNRQMFGPGVVCGLDVDCDPCKPGWLTVSPGYALDCCGNDIVVGCPEHLDALALLSELRRRSSVDCGDPCDDQPGRDYVLVVCYDEQPTDPVAPYAQDDCAVGDCDFSRVREGYRFELVCDIGKPEPNLFDRLRHCVRPGDDQNKQGTAVMTRLARLATTQAKVAAAEESGLAPEVAVPTREEFEAAGREDIDAAAALLGRSTTLLAAAAAHDAGLGPDTGLNANRRRMISNRSRALAEELLGSEQLQALPEIERERMTVVLHAARDQQDLGQLSLAQRLWLAEGLDAADAQRVYAEDAERIRSRIVRAFETTGRGNCRERADIERLTLHRLDANSHHDVQLLARSFLSVAAGCLCDLVNPPCPTCTETKVPLAVVRIEGCEVTNVCGLTRQWVLAPRTLNYWVPIVDMLRPLLIRRCCTRAIYQRSGAEGPASGREIEIIQQAALQALSLLRSPADTPEFSALLTVLSEPVATAEPVAAGPAPAPPSPAPAANTSGATDVADLQRQLAALQDQVAKLAGGGRP